MVLPEYLLFIEHLDVYYNQLFNIISRVSKIPYRRVNTMSIAIVSNPMIT